MRLSEKHSSDMLNAFSHELVNIKKEFETRLTESIQSISDDFLAGSFENIFLEFSKISLKEKSKN